MVTARRSYPTSARINQESGYLPFFV